MIALALLFRYIAGMAATNLEAVIFDYGGVLSLDQAAEHRERMESLSGLPGELLWAEYRRQRPAYDRGTIDGQTYWSQIVAAAGGGVDDQTIPELLREDGESWSLINREMVAWSRTLRAAGYKTAILSNIPRDIIEHIQGRHPWIMEFSVRTYSCRLGIIKPEPGIYSRCLEVLAVAPERALFLDDTPENVSAALALGMRAHLFRSLKQEAPVLRRKFGLPFPAGAAPAAPGPQPG
jgi:putative hydrolase of the HAD superfamily